MNKLVLDVLPFVLSIVRFPSRHEVPKWVDQSGFFSVTRSEQELSVVCETKSVPNDVSLRNDHWKALRVRGPLDFSLTGILSSIALPLAREKISIFTISTFDTDYVLVKEMNLAQTIQVLENSGLIVHSKSS